MIAFIRDCYNLIFEIICIYTRLKKQNLNLAQKNGKKYMGKQKVSSGIKIIFRGCNKLSRG